MDDDWMNEPAPEEILASNPFPAGTMNHWQWRLGRATVWRNQKRFSTPSKSGGEHGSASNANAYPDKSGEK